MLIAVLLLPAGVARSIDVDECMLCHDDPELTKTVKGEEVLLHIDLERFQSSVHDILDCTDCHVDIEDVDHPEELAPADCSGCHEEAQEVYSQSIHGVFRKMGAMAPANCADCHGSHYIQPVTEGNSPVFKMNLPNTCGKCHNNPGLNEEYRLRFPEAVSHYQESIHGNMLMEKGLIVAPSCNDCHGVHDIKSALSDSSRVNHHNIAKTCGKCHLGTEKVFEESVHGKLLLTEGGGKGPTCIDCHTAHEIEKPENGHFKAASDERCGSCHQDMMEYYHETYHGKAMALASARNAPTVAACFDCHGHHDVLPPTNPDSSLSKENIVATCQKCHPNANPEFAAYQAHANPLDKENYPILNKAFIFMTALLVCVFIAFGIHTFMWSARSLRIYLSDSKQHIETKQKVRKDDQRFFTRFTPFQRFLHLLVVSSFLLLVITGMPLKFFYTDWAKAIFAVIGGADVAHWLHRLGAVITFLYFGLHIMGLFWLFLVALSKGRKDDPDTPFFKYWINKAFGPDSMLPNLQDVRDVIAQVKWFFGKGPQPQFDRWTYWEKFDYFAVFWGIFIIGSSGMIMWFPEFFTQFLPGWSINIALIVHSDEALLAAGFIFAFHFFNTHFRIEKFPMDTVIFSGRISETEMQHERKNWYDRLKKEGRLEDYLIKDEWTQWRRIARSMGFLFFFTGLVLLGLIIYAMVTRLVLH